MSEPAGTYAAFDIDVLSGMKVFHYMSSQYGIHGNAPYYKYHITTCFSRVIIPYKPMGILDHPISVTFVEYKLFGDVLVAHVENPILHERFKYAESLGGTWDFPSYIPHITLQENCSLTLEQIANIEPIPFPIFISNEYTEPLDEDIVTKRLKKVAKL